MAFHGPAGPVPLKDGRALSRVAFVTCTGLPDLDPDDALAVAPLRALGATVHAAAWDDPSVDWRSYDLAVLRSTWNYPPVREQFVAWARTVPRLVNPADLVEWNTDKRYLAALSSAGVPVVPTTFLDPSSRFEPPSAFEPPDGEFVVKPSVGAGSLNAGRYGPSTVDRARSHVSALLSSGRTVMVQPYLPAVDTYGETALLYLDGAYSHAIRKGPMLTGPAAAVAGLFVAETVTPRTPSPAERAVADAAIAAVPGRPLYARVDLLPGPSGEPLLAELELTEPSLYLGFADGAPDRFAAAVATLL